MTSISSILFQISSVRKLPTLFFCHSLTGRAIFLGANYGLAFFSIENTLLRFFLGRHLNCVYFGNPSGRPFVRPAVRSSVRPSVRSFVRPSVRPSIRPSVRPSVCLSVRPSGRFHSNGSLEFSDFWYQGSFLLLLKTDGAGFSKKKIWPKMAK